LGTRVDDGHELERFDLTDVRGHICCENAASDLHV